MTIRRDLVPPAPPAAPVVPIEYATADGATAYTRAGLGETVISDPGDGWTLAFQAPTAGNSGVVLDFGPVSGIPGALQCIDSGGRMSALVELQAPPSGDAFFGIGLGEASEPLLPLPSFGLTPGGFLTYLEVSFSGSTVSLSGVEEGAVLGAAPAVARFSLDAAIAGTRSRMAWVQPVGDASPTGEQLDPTGATVPILPPIYSTPGRVLGQGPDNGAGPGSRTATGELHLFGYLFTVGTALHRVRVQMERLRGIAPYSP